MTSMLGSSDAKRDEDTRTFAPGYASILRSQAGRLRYLYELIAGTNPASGEPACTPTNPQGTLGVDKSGPPWGSAWRHTVWGVGGIKPVTAGAGQVEGHRNIGSFFDDEPFIYPIVVTNRRHDPVNGGPYTRLYLSFRGYLDASGAGAVDATVRLRHIAGSDERSRVDVQQFASTNETSFNLSSLWFDVEPGRNKLELIFSSSAARIVHISGLCLDQIVKRTHL